MHASRVEKWIKFGLVSLLVFNVLMCTVPVSAGTNYMIRSKNHRRSNSVVGKPNRGNETQVKRVTLSSRADENMITSIERPPTTKEKVSTNKDKSKGNNGSVSPVQSKTKDNQITKKKFEFGKLKSIFNSISIPAKLKDVVTKMSSVFFGKTGKDGVSTARYTEGFMDGAMVPMTFLLMAAFIMDILQRLFPLPYATFVHQASHFGIKRTEPTPKPSDLTKWQVQTPLGTLGVSTNDKNRNPLNIFGRSNQGFPETVFDTSSHDYVHESEPNYELTPEQTAQIMNWNTNNNDENNNNNHYYNNNMNNHSDTTSFNYDTSGNNQNPYQIQEQQQQQTAESQQIAMSMSVSSENTENTENNENQGMTTTPTQNQDNQDTQGQFDLVDYYSRFDENTEQQWKRRKRTSIK